MPSSLLTCALSFGSAVARVATASWMPRMRVRTWSMVVGRQHVARRRLGRRGAGLLDAEHLQVRWEPPPHPFADGSRDREDDLGCVGHRWRPTTIDQVRTLIRGIQD